MATTLQGGAGIGLAPNFPFPAVSPAVVPTLIGAGPISLAAGATFLLPAGQYYVTAGIYSVVQTKDPVTGTWRDIVTMPNTKLWVSCDGANVRLANLSGCCVGAFITNVGSAYTSAPTVALSAGTATFTAVVGGAISSTGTVGTAGAGYVHAPIIVIAPPPAGGIQATAVATVSAGAVATVTVINQGGGYTSIPAVTVIPDPRDTITTAAAATVTISGSSGKVVGLVRTDHGTPLTSIPTISFTGGGGSSAAATAVMSWVVTGISADTAGAGYGTSQPFLVLTGGGIVPGSAGTIVNPALGNDMFKPRQASIIGTTGAGVLSATGAIVTDAGLFQAVPTAFPLAGGTGLATTQGAVSVTVGGITDTSFIQPF